MKVLIAGASGETGRSIVDGLLSSPTDFDVTAIVRPASINKSEIKEFAYRGVSIVSLELTGPREDVENALRGQDVVICTTDPFNPDVQIILADAAKVAGVRRFVVNAFGPIVPPVGVLLLREIKENIINHIKMIYLPYTIIDVGWWYQGSLPKLPSGKIDYAVTYPVTQIAGEGNAPSSLTDLRDVGRYVARIISDQRTLNKYVFAYNEIWTQEDIFVQLERASGEKLTRDRTSEEDIKSTITKTKRQYDETRTPLSAFSLVISQYPYSVWLRGDNLPASADYLGYLSTKNLYPDFTHTKFVDYVQEVVDGNAKATYVNRDFPLKK